MKRSEHLETVIRGRSHRANSVQVRLIFAVVLEAILIDRTAEDDGGDLRIAIQKLDAEIGDDT